MKTLLVLRHAKSSWHNPALDDHERLLNTRGRRNAPRMGELVREYGLIPDVVISSDAVRARLTAEAVAEAARYAGEILLDPHLYMAWPPDILSLCDRCGKTPRR
jgi:phosphohistidine phosphatase